MKFMGIVDGQTSGACIVEDGRLLAAINEERLVRLKQARGFPRRSIGEVLRISGTRPAEIAGICVAENNIKLREEVDGWPGWFEARAEGRGGVNDYFFSAASRMGGIVPFVPGVRLAYNGLRTPFYRQRRKRVPEILREEFGLASPVKFLHHHYAHATSAYYTSGFHDALVITMDGGGDGHCCHVYHGQGGELKRLYASDSYHSLGNYYAYVTALCGFKAKRHEGKITGLAAYGQPVYEDLLASMIGCRDGRLVNSGRVLFNGALDRLRGALPSGWTAADLAASIQKVSEDVARTFVRYWVDKTGQRNVALAGGLFANVRINEEILGLDRVENLFVHPGMSDEGLGVGAALAMDHAAGARIGRPFRARSLPDVYLGTDIDEAAARKALEGQGLEVECPADLPGRIATLLAEGNVVARASGRMEYGPRALGNRTIMFNPSDPTVNDWLNDLLHRTEFMPFAPSCLDEAVDDLFVNADGGRDTARFMTITFHATPWMKGLGKGAVHLDGTARPQLVRRQDNCEYYDIISRYRSLTGIPAIINTSFNMHEEPIVCTAEDAVRAFLDSSLDYLQLGPLVVKGPHGSQEARRNAAQGESRRARALAQTCR